MEFIKLNTRKILFIFFLCFLLVGGLFGVAYLYSNRIHNPRVDFIEEKLYLIYIATTISLAFFLTYFFGGMYNFYRARKLLSFVTSLDLFDNGIYLKEYKVNRSLLFFNGEWIFGDILGYPVIISVSNHITDYSASSVVLSICVTKFNQSEIENVFFSLKNGRLPETFIDDVKVHISQLMSKGYEKGNMVEGKRKVREKI